MSSIILSSKSLLRIALFSSTFHSLFWRFRAAPPYEIFPASDSWLLPRYPVVRATLFSLHPFLRASSSDWEGDCFFLYFLNRKQSSKIYLLEMKLEAVIEFASHDGTTIDRLFSLRIFFGLLSKFSSTSLPSPSGFKEFSITNEETQYRCFPTTHDLEFSSRTSQEDIFILPNFWHKIRANHKSSSLWSVESSWQLLCFN